MKKPIVFAALIVVLFLATGAFADSKGQPNCHARVSGYVDVNDTSLYYEMKGCGEPVVLVHGITLDARMWDRQFRFLSQHYKVIRYDTRGHGRSAGIIPFSPYWLHEDLRGLLDALGIESAHLVGLSMGGQTVVDFAVTYAERVRSLVHADGSISGFGGWSPEFWTIWLAYFDAWESLPIEGALELWFKDPMFKYILATPGAGRHFEKIVSEHAKQGLGACFSANWYFSMTVDDAIDRLDSITVPTLVIVGEYDLPEFHTCAELLYDGVSTPDHEKSMYVIPGSGHMSNMERPDYINNLLLEFLQDGD
jgi:3-oxoadipate enol-lactonase